MVASVNSEAEPSVLVDVDQVAAMLDVSPRHVYRLVDGGKMPAPLKLGAANRWPRAGLLDWIAEGCRPVRTLARKA